MTVIAVIGNSHTGALRRAWDAVQAENPEIEAIFYASRPYTDGGYGLTDDRLYGPLQPELLPEKLLATLRFLNGAPHADLSRADWIFQIGDSLGMTELMQLLAASDVDGLREIGGDTRISAAAFDAFLGGLARTLDPEMASWSRPLNVPHVLVPQPRRAESALNLEADYAPLKADPAGLPEAAARLEDMAAAHLREVGLSVLLQPPDTVGPLGLTAEEYSIRGEPHGKRDTSGDYKHMNSVFGKRLWTEMIEMTKT